LGNWRIRVCWMGRVVVASGEPDTLASRERSIPSTASHALAIVLSSASSFSPASVSDVVATSGYPQSRHTISPQVRVEPRSQRCAYLGMVSCSSHGPRLLRSLSRVSRQVERLHGQERERGQSLSPSSLTFGALLFLCPRSIPSPPFPLTYLCMSSPYHYKFASLKVEFCTFILPIPTGHFSFV